MLWSGVGLTAALVVTGIATGQIASNQSEEYRDPATSPERRRSLDDSAQALSTTSIVAFTTAAAVGVGTALYYWLGSREPVERTVSAAPLSGGGIVALSGRF